MLEPSRPVRLFLDSGVIIGGIIGHWGAAKAVLILATMRENYTVVLAEAIEREVQGNIARKIASLTADEASTVVRGASGWFDRVRIERYPLPSHEEIRRLAPSILPALRHVNDLPAVITALHAQPDWVLSTNTEHWNERLAERTRLRIATPGAFLRHLHPNEQR